LPSIWPEDENVEAALKKQADAYRKVTKKRAIELGVSIPDSEPMQCKKKKRQPE
jgi:hypothetical protein